ncbi:hypothetical protein [Microcystis aeruginosa]|uniref:Uncharacterized protein n=2 Tax=Microcystis aeruginosa TaxID=1126 RepID=A0A6H9GGL7_MICAE|nr:hypothetical protein [Microcystis aeruginosa]GCL45462.1 hypothetical protein NIES3787_11450 [Microcystis aeruginosa NIES-3787]GCL59596.1 hypothetical protein NIES3807_27720 [Microcystis aeruginosa NIES-3807]
MALSLAEKERIINLIEELDEITLTKVLASFQSFTEYLASVGYDVYRAREPDLMTRLFEFIVNFFW